MYVESILDKKNNHLLTVTGSPNLNVLPLLQTGVNTLNSGIKFIRIRGENQDRSSLAGSGIVLNIDQPIDLFVAMRFGQNIDSPFSSFKRYTHLSLIVSGTGLIGSPISNTSELITTYRFPNGTQNQIEFNLATRNSTGPRITVQFSNVFKTGSFSILNWVYDGNRNSLTNGIGTNSQSFLFNNVPGVLAEFAAQSVPTGYNRLETIGATGLVALGFTTPNANAVQDYFFGERLIFNRVLSANERTFVFNYLSGKWGVQ